MPLLPLPSPLPDPNPEAREFLLTADFGEPPSPPDVDYFLRMLDRDLPAAYVQSLKVGGGYELLRGDAAVAARVARMVSSWDRATLAGYATIGQKARGWVYLYRATSAAGPGKVKAGTIVGTKDRRGFRTQSDVEFGDNDVGPLPVAVEAVLPGIEYNVDGEQQVAYGDAIPGEIDTIWLLLEAPDLWDTSIKVRNPGPMEGGQEPQLEQLARDRGIAPRLEGESVDAFRLRIKSIIRALTPTGIEASVNAILRRWSPYFSCAVIDSWDWQLQTGYDCPIPAAPHFPSTTFVYDDPRPPEPRNRWLTHEGANGGEFYLVLPQLPCLQDQAFFLADPAVTPADRATPGTDGGRRAASFLSLPADLPAEVLRWGLGAGDAAAAGTYSACVKLANDLRAGGVGVQPLLDGLA